MLSKLLNINYFSYVIVLTLLYATCHSLSADEQNTTALDYGKQIYQKGLLSDGNQITALGIDGSPFRIKKTACIDCHRRSGLGTSESGLLIAPITSEYLFKKTTPNQGNKLLDRIGKPHPKYTETTLKAAITSGLRPDGQVLHEVMPRYQFNDKELDYLITYLKSLGTQEVPGLTDHQIDFATVVTPEMSTKDKKLMLNIIKTYFANINKDVRQLDHMKNPLHGRYKPFRRWKLHVWELSGDSSNWPQQLEKYYKNQPVFALLSGFGDWQKIHEFSEKNKVPAIFPITDTPVISNSDYYSLYFSQGISLDATAVVEEINQMTSKEKPLNIVQFYNETATSLLAKDTVHAMLNKKTKLTLYEQKIDSESSLSINMLEAVNKTVHPDILILWLNDSQVKNLLNKHQEITAKHIFLSSRLMKIYEAESLTKLFPTSQLNKITLVHPYYLKNINNNHLLRTKMWAKMKKLNFTQEHILANTYFSLALVTGALHTSQYNLNREYLMEQFEHMIDNTVYHSIYPFLSLGPDQRYASKGTYLINFTPKMSPKWVVPDNY